jgi:hypothetical protein
VKHENPQGILILGDSVVFGWGAPQDSVFPGGRYRNSQVDSHANADGNALIGGVLYKYLESIVLRSLHETRREPETEDLLKNCVENDKWYPHERSCHVRLMGSVLRKNVSSGLDILPY